MHGGDDLISYNMSKKTDGDLNGEIQLHKMKPQEHFIEAQVQEGDTLQAIALRFYCSVSIFLSNLYKHRYLVKQLWKTCFTLNSLTQTSFYYF